MKIFKHVIYLPEFNRDLKKMLKKYRSLKEDIDVFIKIQLNLFHKQNINNDGIVQIPGLLFDVPKVYKAVKFSSKSMKGKGVRTGIRIIYSYNDKDDKIEFIEIYYKGDKENEDRERIVRKYKEPEK